MEVMLVLLTDDFHESNWTNQEVGYAIGKGIPIICLKVGNIDPQGFIGKNQALKSPHNINEAAPIIHRTLIDEIGKEGRLKEILIESFINANSYPAAMESLTRLTDTAHRLTDQEFLRICEGYSRNDQLYNCGGIHNRNNWFKRYLESGDRESADFRSAANF